MRTATPLKNGLCGELECISGDTLDFHEGFVNKSVVSDVYCK